MDLPVTPEPGNNVRRRVMIVDDHVDTAEMLSMLVSGWGHDARSAHTGGSALEIADVFQPDVVFVDLTLPDFDGVELGRRIRQRSWGAPAFLVAVTGWDQASDRQKTRDAGFDLHLVKPVHIDTLRSLLLRLESHDPGPS